MRSLIEFLTRRPDLAGVFGFLVASGFGAYGWYSFREYRGFSAAPARLSVAEATARAARRDLWVTLADAAWRCDRPIRQPYDDATLFLIGDAAGDHPVLAYFDGRIECDEARLGPAAGVLGQINERMRSRLDQAGLAQATDGRAAETLLLCTDCGPANSLGIAVMCGVMALAAMGLYPVFLFMHRRRYAA